MGKVSHPSLMRIDFFIFIFGGGGRVGNDHQKMGGHNQKKRVRRERESIDAKKKGDEVNERKGS